jgi:hypothetical protein
VSESLGAERREEEIHRGEGGARRDRVTEGEREREGGRRRRGKKGHIRGRDGLGERRMKGRSAKVVSVLRIRWCLCFSRGSTTTGEQE